MQHPQAASKLTQVPAKNLSLDPVEQNEHAVAEGHLATQQQDAQRKEPGQMMLLPASACAAKRAWL